MAAFGNRAVVMGLLVSGLAALHGETPKPAPDTPKAVAYGLVIDCTTMMRSHLTAAIELGKALVAGNGAADRTFIVSFSKQENITLEQRFTTKKDRLNEALDNLYAQGGKADLLDAVYLAAEEESGSGDGAQSGQVKRSVVLITTGANEDSFYQLKQVLELLREEHVRVYVIGFPQALKPDGAAETAARKLCQQLADGSGGHAYFPGTREETDKAVREILEAIHPS